LPKKNIRQYSAILTFSTSIARGGRGGIGEKKEGN